jgi:Uma2 family endonuclease
MTVLSPRRQRLLTVAEWALRADAELYELMDGVLRTRPVPQNQHEYTVAKLGSILTGYLEERAIDGMVFGSNTKYRVRARRGVMPDVSVVLGAKADQIDPAAAYNTIGPDLSCEVLSPEQDADYIEERLDDYLRLGASEVWIVNPGPRSVVGYARGEREFAEFARAEGEEAFSSRLLDGLTFSMGLLWMRSRREA